MSRPSKRNRKIAELADFSKVYPLTDAIAILKKSPPTKFDQSVEISLQVGVDPRRSDQQVRATVSLPSGTGKETRVLVFAQGEKAKEAKAAGADFVGFEDLFEKVNGGWTDFDAVIATPDLMREVGKLGKILGPRGLMPTPKAGNVTTDVVRAIKELKGGKIEFKVDKHSSINCLLGKISFSEGMLLDNIKAFLNAVVRAKPASSKGVYLKSATLSTTMGPGVKIDVRQKTEEA